MPIAVYLNANRDYPTLSPRPRYFPNGLIIRRVGRDTPNLRRGAYYVVRFRNYDRIYAEEVVPTVNGWKVAAQARLVYFINQDAFDVPAAGFLINSVMQLCRSTGAPSPGANHFFFPESAASRASGLAEPMQPVFSYPLIRSWPPGLDNAPITNRRRYSSMEEEII